MSKCQILGKKDLEYILYKLLVVEQIKKVKTVKQFEIIDYTNSEIIKTVRQFEIIDSTNSEIIERVNQPEIIKTVNQPEIEFINQSDEPTKQSEIEPVKQTKKCNYIYSKGKNIQKLV